MCIDVLHVCGCVQGKMALHLASQYGRKECVDALLGADAAVDAKADDVN